MSEHQMEGQLCRFCQRNTKLAYYCENCGASCCSDCLDDEKVEILTCQDCNSKNIEVLDSGKKKVCKDCGKENIIKVTQHIASCPKCHSQRIVNIYEKKEKLEQTFLELIKSSRHFIKPFQNIINYLYLIRQKVKKARDPPIRCYHFPKMESDLLSLFKLLKYVENNLLEKINIHFHYLASNKDHFFDVYSQPNSNIRIIEGILENLERSHESIDDFIEKNIETINKDLENLKKNLHFIDKITDYFSTYKRFINLAEEEKPVYALQAKLSNGLTNQEIFKKKNGFLFITNLDLSFVHDYGFFKKKQELIFKAPVNDLIRIKEKGKLFKKLYIEFPYGKYEFSLPNKAINRVIEYILLARNFDETTIFDRNSDSKLKRINIDLNDLKNFIEDGINSFFSLKCKHNNELAHKSEGDQNSYTSGNNHPYRNLPNYNNLNQNYKNKEPYRYEYPNSDLRNAGRDFQSNNQYQGYMREENPNLNPPHESRKQYERNTGRNNFVNQDLFNPHRFQNYDPRFFTRNQKQPINPEFKNFLMKKLQQKQRINQLIGNQMPFENSVPYSESLFQDYNKNHLSELFDNNDIFADTYNHMELENNIFENMEKNYKIMLELKKERYSLQETIKNLDEKFEQGMISEVEFIRFFRKLNKDLYDINKKIRIYQQKFEDEESIRDIGRKYDANRYFT